MLYASENLFLFEKLFFHNNVLQFFTIMRDKKGGERNMRKDEHVIEEK